MEYKILSDGGIESRMNIPMRGSADVIFAGGGVAGCAAALEAARHGCSVILFEKSMMLGGLATLGLVNWFVPMDDGKGRQVIFGMAEEFLRLSIKYGYGNVNPGWKNGVYEGKSDPPPRYCSGFSADIFALCLTELLNSAGVELRFDASAVDILTRKENSAVATEGVIIHDKSGFGFYKSKIVVDVTGDADLLYKMGVPTLKRGNYDSYFGKVINMDSIKKALESGNIGNIYRGVSGGYSNLYGHGHPIDMPLFDGTDADDISRYTVSSQIRMLEKLKKDDRLSRDLVQIPGMVNFRATRRLDGDATLRPEDSGIRYDDSIGAICDFDGREYLYEVRYGVLVKTGFDGIITAGRTASGDGYGWDILRVIPPAIITGQAAGLAAAESIKNGNRIWEPDIRKLQSILESEDVKIHNR
ncbi:MAG: FAD-dependent oxidoreductase [Eubacteriales bacterium]|jgi:hypothetical protein